MIAKDEGSLKMTLDTEIEADILEEAKTMETTQKTKPTHWFSNGTWQNTWAVSVGQITTLRDSDSCAETTLEVLVKLRWYLFAIKHPELSQILEHTMIT